MKLKRYLTEENKETKARNYIKKIKNKKKKEYAEKYMKYLLKGGSDPDHGELSTMAAQAVRMNLSDILDIYK